MLLFLKKKRKKHRKTFLNKTLESIKIEKKKKIFFSCKIFHLYKSLDVIWTFVFFFCFDFLVTYRNFFYSLFSKAEIIFTYLCILSKKLLPNKYVIFLFNLHSSDTILEREFFGKFSLFFSLKIFLYYFFFINNVLFNFFVLS